MTLSGCSEEDWKSLNVPHENRPVTLEWVANAPPITDVYFVSESLGWAPGSDGTIWRTDDGGKTWEGIFVDRNLDIDAVQFLSDGRKGWAVAGKANATVLLTTDNGGEKWEVLYQVPRLFLHVLHFSSASNGCVGSGNTIRCTTDGGQTWATKTAEPDFVWTDLHFLNDARHGWAVANFHGDRMGRSTASKEVTFRAKLFSTVDGGWTWNPVGEKFTDRLLALQFSSEQNGWALTVRYSSEETTSKLLYTSDGGATWTTLGKQLNGDFRDLQFAPDGRHGLLVGNSSREPHVLYTKDSGTTWSSLQIDLDERINKLHFLSGGGSTWIVGNNNSLLHSKDLFHWEPLTKRTGRDLSTIQFAADGKRGWVHGSGGIILHTRDGGVHWERQYSEPSLQFHGLTIDDQGQRGWAIGNGAPCLETQIQLLNTYDGGGEWKASCVEAGYRVLKGYLRSNGKGWAFAMAQNFSGVQRGVITITRHLIFSPDFGQTWRSQYTFPGTEVPKAAHFTKDGTNGWIVTSEQKLYSSNDSGQTWTELRIEPEPSIGTGYTINAVTFMANNKRGWAVGGTAVDQSLVLHTTDGGASWKRQEVGTLDSDLQSVAFLPDGVRGWATGAQGKLIYTSDGGEHWKIQTVAPGVEVNLNATYVFSDTQGVHAWIAGNDGTILRSVAAKTHPLVNQYQVSSSATGVELKWQLANDPAPAWKLENLKWQLEYCSQKECTADTWQKILPWQSLNPNSTSGSNVFSYTWNPADKGIAPGTQISYRIGVYDGNQWSMPQELGTHTFQPLWSRLTDWQKALLIVLALILAYICVCLLLLAFRPRAVLWLHERLSLHTLIEPWAPAQLKPWLPSTLSFVPWLAKHRRVHEAWAKHYLATEDVKLSDLSPGIQQHYVKQDACLDAWVAKHLSRGQELFLQLPTVAQRIIHILMPIQIETVESGTLVVQPQAEHFRPYMQSPRVVLSIVGIGGAGKSSLACQLARWSMSSVEDQRLASHCMIPILIEEDTTDVPGVIKERLAIIAGDDLPEDLLENLLAKKRLLVIIDALSEKSKDMQDHVSNLYSTCPAHCLVITTRRPIHVLGAMPVTLRPQEITVDRLAYFLLEHLRATGREHLFPRRKALEVADRLLTIAEADGEDLPLTPLLVVLFANQAVKLAEAGQELNRLPASVPETMIDYIKHLNLNKRLPERDLIDSALALARQSLGNDYVPKEFERRKAIAALADRKLWRDSEDSLQELANSGILEERESAGTILYHFKFDPVAEYMAAVERVRTLTDDSKAWQEWINTLKEAEGYPKRMDGFLIALQVCVATYQRQFNLPFLQLQNEDCPILVSQNS